MGVQTYIDGTEVTDVVVEGSSTRRLNQPSQASIKIPIDYAIGEIGSRLKVNVDGYGLHFHGMILTISDEGDEDKLYTEYVAMDPMELWRWRPARDADGDFSKPTFFETQVTGPQILEYILQNTEDAGDIPAAADGPLFITYGTFETGGVDLSAAPVDWPMTIAEVANLLTSTGEVDIVLTPIDVGGNMAEVNIYNGDYGTNLSGSVFFDYATGSYNARGLRRVQDGTNICNKLWYYLGPRVETPEDPAGDQHWRANIQGDDTGLAYPPGGENSPPGSATNNQLGVLRISSQGDYGVRMEIKIFDARGDESTVGRDLYRRLWQVESWLRAQPRELVHLTPVRGTALNFDIGDLVTVRAGAKVRGGFTGIQRIYEYTVSWDENGTTEIGEIVTSPNQEGI
jgi:hypothetical protein